MAFNFGGTSGQGFGSPFGSTPVTTSTPSLFGATPQTTSAFGQPSGAPAFGQSAGAPFGGVQSPQPQQSLFGQPSQPQASAFGSAPAFGQSSQPFGGQSAFGANIATSQPNTQSVFGSFGASQPSVPAFGSGFGGQTTTPATSSSGGLFSFPSAQQQQQPQQQSQPSLFGAPAAPATTQSMFGSPFGSGGAATVAPQSSQSTSLFGVTPQQTSQSSLSFGGQPSLGSSTFGQSSLPAFGAIASTPAAPAFSTGGSLFGSNLGTPTAVTSAPVSTFGGFGQSTGFGAPAAVPTSAAPAFNFGAAVPTATTTTPSLSFSLPTQTPSTLSTSTPVQPSFGTSAGFGLTAPIVSASAPSAGGFGFGASATAVAPIASATAPSFTFPSATAPAATTGASIATVQPLPTLTAPAVTTSGLSSAPSFNFGQTSSAAPTFSLTTPSTAASATTTAATFGLNLSTPLMTSTGASTLPSLASTTTSAVTLPTAKTTAFTLQPTTTVTTTQTIATVTPKNMTFRQLEDQINIWLNELNQLEAEFHIQAQTINSWDSLLINNGLKITQINETVEKLRTDHTRLDHQLDFIIAQQNELEQLLAPIEANKVDLNTNNTVNTEREFTYSLVETVHNDLNGIGGDLKNFIKRLNEMRANQDTTDPLAQIAKILNSHMDALQWIENQIKNIKITAN